MPQSATTSSSDTTPLQTDEGTVTSITSDQIVITRDNGSSVRLQIQGPQASMPAVGDRVSAQYRLAGSQRTLVKIESR